MRLFCRRHLLFRSFLRKEVIPHLLVRPALSMKGSHEGEWKDGEFRIQGTVTHQNGDKPELAGIPAIKVLPGR